MDKENVVYTHNGILCCLKKGDLAMCGMGLPRWLGGKDSACLCRRHGFNPQVGKNPGRRECNPLQYPCWENPMDISAWGTTVHEVTDSRTGLSIHACMHAYHVRQHG